MKSRAVVAIIAVVMAFLLGCAGNSGNKRTGFAYLLHREPTVQDNTYDNPITAVPGGPQVPVPAPQTINKKVYLTFDDGPNNSNTPLVMDILDSYGVKATFFVVGTQIEKYPEVFKELVKRGHAIGNHTYNHKYNDIYADIDSFLQSVKTNEELINRIIGQRPRIVRDPGGEVRNNESVKRALAENGYRLIDWNVDSYDSRKPFWEGQQIVETIRRQSQKVNLWPQMVILMHDGTGHLNTVRALPTVIELLKAQGFKFEVIK